jgi:hypothetical protein
MEAGALAKRRQEETWELDRVMEWCRQVIRLVVWLSCRSQPCTSCTLHIHRLITPSKYTGRSSLLSQSVLLTSWFHHCFMPGSIIAPVLALGRSWELANQPHKLDFWGIKCWISVRWGHLIRDMMQYFGRHQWCYMPQPPQYEWWIRTLIRCCCFWWHVTGTMNEIQVNHFWGGAWVSGMHACTIVSWGYDCVKLSASWWLHKAGCVQWCHLSFNHTSEGSSVFGFMGCHQDSVLFMCCQICYQHYSPSF